MPEESPTPTIEVGESPKPENLLDKLSRFADEARQEELTKQFRRDQAAREIAEARWTIARDIHILEDGESKLDFTDRPYLKALYKDACLDRVVYGSAQWGKTVLLVCDLVACAMYGLKCLVVISTGPKRDAFSKTRLNPCFEMVPAYQAAIKEAAAKGHEAGNVRVKGFGSGSIALIAATVRKEFTTIPADVVWVDEYQECDQNNLLLLDDRLSGSWFRGLTRIGHPTTDGSEQNGNLDWLYKNSDQRQWLVPCGTCGRSQLLNWWTHIVEEKRNKQGAIISLRPRDQEFAPTSKWDMRAICRYCNRPMNRLTKKGNWHLNHPGVERHGWKLGNLYNPNVTIKGMYERYSKARHKPHELGEFVNKQLGEAWSVEGSKIEEHILALCADGETGIPPYRFYPVSGLTWRKQLQEESQDGWKV